jgi:predicted ATP-grasp superfamily ATP-dependent carboligase
MSHSAEPQLLYACNNTRLKIEMENSGLEPMPDGIISGLNGLILGFAETMGIDAVCLLATIPAYAAGLTYPRAALTIIRNLSSMLGVDIDYSVSWRRISRLQIPCLLRSRKSLKSFSHRDNRSEAEEGEEAREEVFK